MNIPLLRKSVAKVMASPATLDMDTWGKLVEIDEEHPCGTVGCIALQVVLIEEPKTFRKLVKSPYRDDIQDVARLLLDLNLGQARRLFHLDAWPYGFFLDYTNPKAKTNDRAAVLRDRVEHFISTFISTGVAE